MLAARRLARGFSECWFSYAEFIGNKFRRALAIQQRWDAGCVEQISRSCPPL